MIDDKWVFGKEATQCARQQDFDWELSTITAGLVRLVRMADGLDFDGDRHGLATMLEGPLNDLMRHRDAHPYMSGQYPDGAIPELVTMYRNDLHTSLMDRYDELMQLDLPMAVYYMSMDAACRVFEARLEWGYHLELARSVTWHQWMEGEWSPAPPHDSMKVNFESWLARIDSTVKSIIEGSDDGGFEMTLQSINRWEVRDDDEE